MLEAHDTLKTLQQAPYRDVADPAAAERVARAAHDKAVVDAIWNMHQRLIVLTDMTLELDRRLAIFDDPTRRETKDEEASQTSAPVPELPVVVTPITDQELVKLGLMPGPATGTDG